MDINNSDCPSVYQDPSMWFSSLILNVTKFRTSGKQKGKKGDSSQNNLKLISKLLMSLEINLRFLFVCSIVLNLA